MNNKHGRKQARMDISKIWPVRLINWRSWELWKILKRTKYIPVSMSPTVPSWEGATVIQAALLILFSICIVFHAHSWLDLPLFNWWIFRLRIFCQYDDATNNLIHTSFCKRKHLSKIYVTMLTLFTSWTKH